MSGWRKQWPGIYLDNTQVVCGDAVEVLRDLEDGCVHCVVTDPPYDLTTGKKGGTGPASLNLDSPAGRSRITTGFMGLKWDGTGIAFTVELWAEVLRVLKPGGHMVVFGGTRTFHRLTCAVEDAGFEIRDCLMWLYGTGFPKSLNVGKAIDKAAGAKRGACNDYAPDTSAADPADRDICTTCFYRAVDHGGIGDHVGTVDFGMKNRCRRCGLPFFSGNPCKCPKDAPATSDAARWEGWGTALKPAWEPIVLARKPLAGTVAGNVLAHGTGALNIDGCRIGASGGGTNCAGGDDCHCDTNKVFGATKHAVRDRSQPVGRWPANAVLSHAPGCVEAGERRVRSARPDRVDVPDRSTTHSHLYANGVGLPNNLTVWGYGDADGTETMAAYECQPGCPVSELDGQSGQSNGRAPGSKPRTGKRHDEDTFGGGRSGLTATVTGPEYSDNGGASRFFQTTEAAGGRWPANVVLSHLEGCVEAGTRKVRSTKSGGVRWAGSELGQESGWNDHTNRDTVYIRPGGPDGVETVPAWQCQPGCPVAELDEQSGQSTSKRADRGVGKGATGIYGEYGDSLERVRGHDDSGGASRFFYCAKAGKKERPSAEGVNHPTVKPLALMRWLVRLVAPPEGIVLDPFLGSGTTLEACVLEGFRGIGIESAAEYVPLIEERLRRVR